MLPVPPLQRDDKREAKKIGGWKVEITEEVKEVLIKTAQEIKGSACRLFMARTVRALEKWFVDIPSSLLAERPQEARPALQEQSPSQKRSRGRPRIRPLPDPTQPKRLRGALVSLFWLRVSRR